MAFRARLQQPPSICVNVAYKVKELSDVSATLGNMVLSPLHSARRRLTVEQIRA